MISGRRLARYWREMVGVVLVSFQEPHSIHRIDCSDFIGHTISNLAGKTVQIFVGCSTDSELLFSSIQKCSTAGNAVAQLILYNAEGKANRLLAKFSRVYDCHIRNTACRIEVETSEAITLDAIGNIFDEINATALVQPEFPNLIVSTNVIFNQLFNCVSADSRGKPFHTICHNLVNSEKVKLETPKNGQVSQGTIGIRSNFNEIITNHFSCFPVVKHVNDTIQFIAISFSSKTAQVVTTRVNANRFQNGLDSTFSSVPENSISKGDIGSCFDVFGVLPGDVIRENSAHNTCAWPNDTRSFQCASAPMRPESQPLVSTITRGRCGKRSSSPGFEQVRRIYRKLRRAELRSAASEGSTAGACNPAVAVPFLEAWRECPDATEAAAESGEVAQGPQQACGDGDGFDVEGMLDLLSVEWARRA
jgi:hypothetical protein